MAQCLGFNLAPSSIFFLLSPPSYLYRILLLRYYVVVILALRVPSNSVSLLHSFSPCLHTSFPICLLKFSCNLYPTSTYLMTNTLRMLESRVFLHYLINITFSFFIILSLFYFSILIFYTFCSFFIT